MKRAAGAVLLLFAAAGCEGRPTSLTKCEYTIYPPNGVQLQVGGTRYVESFSNCSSDLDIEMLTVTGWTSSNSAVVGVTPRPDYTQAASLQANAAGTAIITAAYSGGRVALLEVVVTP